MLEFIVLGQIPGTSFVITFSWVVAMLAIGGGAVLLHSTHKHHQHPHQLTLEDTTL